MKNLDKTYKKEREDVEVRFWREVFREIISATLAFVRDEIDFETREKWYDNQVRKIRRYVSGLVKVERLAILEKVENELIGEDEGYIPLELAGKIIRKKKDIEYDKSRNDLRKEQRSKLSELNKSFGIEEEE